MGQAKFLETPARTNMAAYASIIKDNLRKGRTLAQSLLLAGLALQRDAQLLTPVLTGNLRRSAFTRVESGE